MIRQSFSLLLTAGRLLFLTLLSEEIIIPVEIENGGQAVITADQQSFPLPQETVMRLSEGETDSWIICFSMEGSWTYRIEQIPASDMICDDTVYLLSVSTGPQGVIESVLLNREGSDEKAQKVSFINRPRKKEIPDTSDVGVRGYLLTSAVSLFLTLILFKAKGSYE